MLDLVVDRRDMKATIARALRFMRVDGASDRDAEPLSVAMAGSAAGPEPPR
jgi:hypothetical protein